jgi:2-iminobutanoate/2-iminopropanoate deaminase
MATMMKPVNPPDVHALGRFSPGIEVSSAARQLHVSGQVGLRPDGTLAEGIEAQLECTWANVLAVLRAAGMGPQNVVKVTTYVTDPAHLKLHAPVRARILGEHRPAATTVCVSALASPDYLCEIEVLAVA